MVSLLLPLGGRATNGDGGKAFNDSGNLYYKSSCTGKFSIKADLMPGDHFEFSPFRGGNLIKNGVRKTKLKVVTSVLYSHLEQLVRISGSPLKVVR